MYYLWSFEHGAFWAPNRDGYTTDVRLAGTYTTAIAEQIVESARGNEVALAVGGTVVRPAIIAYDPQNTFHVL